MFGLGFPELIVILLVVLLLFGAERLPRMGEALGRSIKNFKKSMSTTDDDKKSGSNQNSSKPPDS